MKSRKASRSGVVLVCVLACLAVHLTLAWNGIRVSLQTHRESKYAWGERQVRLIADAGILRAAKKLAADPAYIGETWSPQVEWNRKWNADVTIAIAELPTLGERTKEYSITVKARLQEPEGNGMQLQRSRNERITVQMKSKTTNESNGT